MTNTSRTTSGGVLYGEGTRDDDEEEEEEGARRRGEGAVRTPRPLPRRLSRARDSQCILYEYKNKQR